ncbi:MAG: hypothetical protein HRT44_08690 [Bdellovibrionales bacterium]|nr:hypothetical protein [Bdellovibrionales bacterium]NQZ19317.1 hypothetical protein [Bdellovibrionales bacterium]
MKILKYLSIVVFFFGASAFGFYAYMGGFKDVTVEEQNLASMEIIFSTHLGAYENLSQSWEAFAVKYEEAGLEDCNAIGVYLDKPETPPEERRTILGCKIGNLSPELQETLKSKFGHFVMPEAQTISSSFPYRNMMSFFMAPTKVYPKFLEQIVSGKFSPSVAIEDYGLEKGRNKILFYMPTNQTVEAYKPLFEAF